MQSSLLFPHLVIPSYNNFCCNNDSPLGLGEEWNRIIWQNEQHSNKEKLKRIKTTVVEIINKAAVKKQCVRARLQLFAEHSSNWDYHNNQSTTFLLPHDQWHKEESARRMGALRDLSKQKNLKGKQNCTGRPWPGRPHQVVWDVEALLGRVVCVQGVGGRNIPEHVQQTAGSAALPPSCQDGETWRRRGHFGHGGSIGLKDI